MTTDNEEHDLTASNYRPVDLSTLRSRDLASRGGLVHVEQFATLPEKGCSFLDWMNSLPDFLGAKQLKVLAADILAARRAARPVIWAMGGHVVKVGCGPIVCDLMRRGIVTAIAMNGATATHDAELALAGQTSEDVDEALSDGTFGMAREAAEVYAEAASIACRQDAGLGASIGRVLLQRRARHNDLSILATAADLGLPATVHAALGAEVVHMHACLDPALLGRASQWDFRQLCSIVSDLGAASPGAAGGLWVNIGSAVVLPEVFLKTVAVARNLGVSLDGMVTANLDMMRHYRTRQNVLNRPVGGGRSHELIGQHEILLPLLRQMLIEMGGY